ncbi:putative gpi anchored cfem domain protein [Zalerion maritima]|uniref:Gpi anchored cfem domain protein n=1 Tax=Zalerion maritima TaxID=339359 RepID=A0AAD5WQT3_9PEZI|nr:putative gpi anchored cfem domain protein [Zalerion maritima]
MLASNLTLYLPLPPQEIPDLPRCVHDCVLYQIPSTDCVYTDVKCQCESAADIFSGLDKCARENCTARQKELGYQLLADICEREFGVNYTGTMGQGGGSSPLSDQDTEDEDGGNKDAFTTGETAGIVVGKARGKKEGGFNVLSVRKKTWPGGWMWTEDPRGPSPSGLDGGHIAAIVITGVVILAAIGTTVHIWLKRRRQQKRWAMMGGAGPVASPGAGGGCEERHASGDEGGYTTGLTSSSSVPTSGSDTEGFNEHHGQGMASGAVRNGGAAEMREVR